jgi:endonuclease/exonuclease/phosphatase family metal-dependent hydrolase
MPMLRIDHIFCSPSVEALGIDVPRTRLAHVASDHLPLVMDFRLGSERTADGHTSSRQDEWLARG